MRWLLQICFTVMALLASASVSSAASCADDPNECTLKKLCEASTTLDGSNTIWATTSETAKHVALAQSLGMECGVTPIVDLCETDPSECKVGEICEKATTESAGQKTWDDSAAAHVALAKEYGLSCGVLVGLPATSVKKECSASNVELCSEEALCKEASFSGSNATVWFSASSPFVIEAKKRGLTCGIGTTATNFKKAFTSQSRLKRQQLQYALKKLGYYSYRIDGLWGKGTSSGFDTFVSVRGLANKTEAQVFNSLLSEVDVPSSFAAITPTQKACSASNPKVCTNAIVCNRANWGSTTVQVWIKEGKRRGLTCGVIPQANTTKSDTAGSTTNDTAGLTAIISNPSMTGTQALAICRPQAELAKSQARSQADSMGGSGRRTYDLDCSFGSCRARDVTSSGGAWGGIAKGLSIAKAGKRAYSAVLEACLAGYGWR